MPPSASGKSLPIPDYLQAHYWWAYVHPRAVHFFERQWLVNLILWGNYNRLRARALEALGSPVRGRLLQVACAYGDITPRLVQGLDQDATLDIVDILPVQLGNLGRKLSRDERVRMHCMNSACLRFEDASFDQILLFFLLHEQPADVRDQTLQEAARVLRPGGRMVIVDYSRPAWFNPFRYLWKPVLKVIEPFSADLLDHGVARWIPRDRGLCIAQSVSVFGGLYQMLVIEKPAD
jgi:ubiquinone/menaquinone biosynthesis C-methylase UbiE